jgi:hypothetical protein
MVLFALLAAGAARTTVTGPTTTFHFDGARFAAAEPGAALRVYQQAPASLGHLATTTLRACLAGEHLPAFACRLDPSAAALPAVTMGALYEAWHAPPAYAQSLVEAQGARALAVEDVLRSNGTLALADIYARHPGAAAQADGFLYQERPALGYYCLYRHRAGQAGLIPDCANISGTVAWQAGLLRDASVDFITVDGTNLCTPSDQEELIQQRPMEVVLEEFYALRRAGVATPRVAAWQRIVPGCTTYPAVLALYNNASYVAADLFLRAPSGKRVFFVPAGPDPALVAAVESNGGRNDIVTQVMWALFAQPDYAAKGEWGFMSPCTDAASGGYTTSVAGLGRGATGCGQNFTQHSALGSAAAVSPSYQLSYGSVPFSAAGKFEGLTLQRQFGTIFDAAGDAFAAGAPAPLPDNIYLSSWNEWTSQPQPNPFASNWSFSMGLQGDADGRALYVDSFGSALSRDLEPSDRGAGGSALYELLTSCTRVVRLMQGMAAHHGASGSGSGTAQLARFFGARGVAAAAAAAGAPAPPLASCAVAGEACCAYNETRQGYALARSLARRDLTDALASADAREVAALLAGGAWEEVCNGYGGGTDFCVDGGVLASQRRAGQGPFLLHSGGCGAAVAGSGADPRVALAGRVRVQRCAAPGGGGHFLAAAADCGGAGTPEAVLGCADAQRSSNMPRALHACTRSGSGSGSGAPPFYHALDVPCLAGDAQTLLGYAH